MMINPTSIAHLREQFGQYRQADAAKIQSDLTARDHALQAMRQDWKAGDVDGAKAERAAALQAQKISVADRASLHDLQKQIREVHSDLRQRTHDLHDLRAATHNGDLAGMQRALKAIGQSQADIRKDVRNIRSHNAVPVDVTA